ncbi:MAG: methylenetetrahydrofolate--tRNA-(uracil(54)-C(5))-methyltransferase (FADH(2)-oxidizing) TrmFO [Bacteriovoracaceae bacterium]|jgi:methylenetetrahydrofolate--tRNA-(uracil-5-)-methyltransferase|nr:methylenetetrahydrofolate--tRNA-(uracil(54)-C(5))-methyltransferase (FADH(2)-oxidizing) TrmFO [Bacteriovoracaceae bacterium]
MENKKAKVVVVGAGLAGSEAAFSLAQNDVEVILLESKTIEKNPAQKMSTCAELVCTNSLKSLKPETGHGLLKYEMEKLGSLVLKVGHETRVPAGDALAVDREEFSKKITDILKSHKNITFIERVVDNPAALKEEFDADFVVVATGPLTTKGLESWLIDSLTQDDFYFYDAIAPVVDADSLDYSKLYFKDRHKDPSETADYLNAPMNEQQYYSFVEALKEAQKVPAKDFEDYQFFEACLPIDIMAERGPDTPRFSCMKPIGLEFEGNDSPYAVVQLRKENLLGSAFNMVGFQTRLKYPEQKRVFRMIPGFENAEFIHLGSVHRNSFLNSRSLLNFDLSSKKYPYMFFAGQITGVEGYTESSSMGLYVAFQILRKINGKEPKKWPVETGIGALINYIMTVEKPSPSSINFGLLPQVPLTKEQRRKRAGRKKLKKELAAKRANEALDRFFDSL